MLHGSLHGQEYFSIKHLILGINEQMHITIVTNVTDWAAPWVGKAHQLRYLNFVMF